MRVSAARRVGSSPGRSARGPRLRGRSVRQPRAMHARRTWAMTEARLSSPQQLDCGEHHPSFRHDDQQTRSREVPRVTATQEPTGHSMSQALLNLDVPSASLSLSCISLVVPPAGGQHPSTRVSARCGAVRCGAVRYIAPSGGSSLPHCPHHFYFFYFLSFFFLGTD